MSSKIKTFTGFVLAAAITLQPMFLAAQQAPMAPPAPSTITKINPIGLPDFTRSPKFYEFRNYRPIEIANEGLSNSPKIDSLMRDGKIYLSLSDALMMAIENNLDVAIQRLNPAM